MATTHSMGNADAAWLHMDRPTNLMIITSALWFDTPLDEARLRELLRERLIERYPPFARRVVEGLTGPHWEDVEVDLDLHLHRYALPAPGDRAALETVVGDLMSQPLDRSRPLWSVHLLEGYGEGCALVFRMHHSIADGIALARVMLGLTDDGRTATRARFSRPSHGRSTLPVEGTVRELAQLAGGALREATETVLHPRHFGELAGEAFADARALAKFLTVSAEREHALHTTLGARQQAAWTRPYPLADVKQAAKRHQGTINDVLVACVAGAVRAHLQRSGEDPDDVRAMVPFNLRPLDQPLPRDLGNRFGLVLLDLPVSVPDATGRVRSASRRMNALKGSREGAVSYAILGAIGHTPPVVESRIVDLFSSKATMVLTNVPGPRNPVYLAGSQVGGVLVWAPCSGAVGMSVSIFSYDGEVTVGFLVNGSLHGDAADLVAAFEDAADEILAG